MVLNLTFMYIDISILYAYCIQMYLFNTKKKNYEKVDFIVIFILKLIGSLITLFT